MFRYLKRFISTYVRPRWLKFSVVQAMHVLAGALLLIPPLLLKHIIDDIIPQRDYAGLMAVVLLTVGIFAVWAILAAVKEYWGHEVAQRITSWLRNDLYGHFQKLSMSFHDDTKTGELLSRLVDDVNVIEEFAHHGPETLLLSLAMIAGTTGLLFWLSWRLAIVALCVAPLLVIFARNLSRRMWEEFREVRKHKAALTDVLEENLTGMRIIQAFVGEDREAEAVSLANEKHYRGRMRVIRWVATMFPGARFINSMAVAMVLLYGGIQVMEGAIKIGTFVAFVLYLQRFLEPIMRLMMMVERSGQFFAGMERFFDYMDIEPDIMDRPGAVALDGFEGRVQFRDVWFRYDRDHVLQGINLTARPGDMVALVGPSGAGKTTITRLIPRFYEPQQGSVLVDGRDVRDLQLRTLRAHIGMVMQDDFLFSGTVADNIAYGRPGATREEIIEVARQANADPFIGQLPDGYDTEIGKRGVKLSEGQRQRVSIARALLKNPQILLLDEATSSVDSETELLIQQAVERLRKGRTTFAIAHRLSTILHADQILFVQEGGIVESGTHAQLMEQDGLYARFYRIQFSHPAGN